MIMKNQQGDRDEAQEITASWKYIIFHRKALNQANIAKGRRGKDFIYSYVFMWNWKNEKKINFWKIKKRLFRSLHKEYYLLITKF